MPCPKHKVQRRHRRNRRAANHMQARNVTPCPRCGEEKLPHRVCLNCGHYKDFEVIEVED